MAEDTHARGTERLRRANEHLRRLLHAVNGVQNDREQRAEEGDVDDRAFLGRPEQDGQRNPRNPGDWTQDLNIRKDEVADEPQASHQQTERDPDAGRQRITDGDASQAGADVQVERDLLQLVDQRFGHLERTGDLLEADIQCEARRARVVPARDPGQQRR